MSEFQGLTADLATVMVDLNGKFNGDETGFTVVRFEPGVPDPSGTFLAGGQAGGEQIDTEPPPVKGSLELLAEGSTDIEELRSMFADLSAWLNERTAVLLVQPDGQDEPVYYDTYRSPFPAMYTGRDREGLDIVERLLVRSYVFEFWHHPYPRTAGLTLATEDVANGVGGGNVLEVTNPGSAPSEGRLALTIEGSEHVVWGLVGVKRGALEFPSYDISTSETVFDAWQMLHRQVLTPSDADAFEGTYRAVVVYTPAADVFHFQVQYGTAVDGPQANAGTVMPVEHDWSDISVFNPVPLDLGEVRFDARDPRLVIEVWGRSEGGADVGLFDALYLIPSDETFMELSSPGFLSGTYGLARYDGDSLVLGGGASVNDDGDVLLEAGGTAYVPSVYVDGNSYPIGRHNWELRGNVKNKDRTREKEGELQVYLNGEVTASITRNITSRKGELVTRWGDDDRRQVSWDVTDPDDHYLEGVEFTEAGGPGKQIHIETMRHSYIPWITDGRSMVVDQGRRESFIADDTGATIAKLKRTATLYIPAGEVSLAFLFGVQSPNRYDGVDPRGTLPVIDAVTAGAVLDVTPRRLGP